MIRRFNAMADQYLHDEREKYTYMKEVLQIMLDTPYEATPPVIEYKANQLLAKVTGIEDFHKESKDYFNHKILGMEDQIESILASSQNPLLDALRIALAGNIIDFGTVEDITFDKVKELIKQTLKQVIDMDAFENLKSDLSKKKKLLYLGDNVGEIVLDKIFIQYISTHFPNIEVVFATRGTAISSDVLEEDAYAVGMDQYASIINNGSGLPGTDLTQTSSEFNQYFNQAEVIIAKGQGNFETLYGTDANIYYLFLSKCPIISNTLKVELYSPMLVHE